MKDRASMTPEANQCAECGAPITDGGEDSGCPACLMAAAIGWGREASRENEESGQAAACGGYRLERVIGRGGSGVVYQARPAGGGPVVALKRLALAHAAGVDELRRFRFEMEAGAALEHPHLVKVLEHGEADGIPYYVMELAVGGTLSERIREMPDRTQAMVRVGWLVKVARAVHFAHERGVLHRDLKPANLLFGADGEPRVADFGLARLLHAPAGLTLTGLALGTPAYMAPEQAEGGLVTTAADQYSLGAILFHAVTGRPPFAGASPMEVLRQVTAGEVPDPAGLVGWLDRDLATVCRTAMRRDPARRYPSVAAMADDLERWLRGEPVLARPLGGVERAMRWCRRHPVVAAISATAGLAAVAILGLYVAGSEILREERNRALGHEQEAREHAKAAEQARDEFQQNSYAADVYLAYRAFDDGHLGQARATLARHAPAPGDKDLRGFEWHALRHLCRGDDTAAWREHDAAVTCVAFHPRQRWLASGGRDGKIVVREYPGGAIRTRLPRPDAPRELAEIAVMSGLAAKSMEFGTLLLGGRLKIDDARMRGRPAKLGEIHALAWSPDGTRLLSGGGGSYLRMWDMPQGELTGLVPVTGAVGLGFSGDGTRLWVFALEAGQWDRHELRVYHSASLALERVIGGLQAAHAVSPDGTMLAVMPEGTDRVEIHEIATGVVRSGWDAGVGLKQLAFAVDGRSLLGVEWTGMLTGVWALPEGRRAGSVFPVAGRHERILPVPGGRFLATTGAGQTIAWQAVAADAPAALWRGHEDRVMALAVSPDGDWLASGGNDHTVRLWSTRPTPPVAAQETGFPTPSPTPPTAWLQGFGEEPPWVATARGTWIGDGRRDGRIVFRPRGSTDEALELPPPPGRYGRIVAAADGTVGVCVWPRGIYLLENGGASWGEELRLSEGTVGPVVFSPDSRWIASGGDDNRISIRERKDGRLLASLRGHQAAIADLAFSPDGRTLVSSAADQTLRLWHLPTWREVGTLHRGEVLGKLEFSADGTMLRARTADGSPRCFSGENDGL